jgi:hypothetical protein
MSERNIRPARRARPLHFLQCLGIAAGDQHESTFPGKGERARSAMPLLPPSTKTVLPVKR